MDPEQLKGLGNTCLNNKEYDQAINHYTEAIKIAKEQNKSTHVYYSNRCAAFQSKEDYEKAFDDSLCCIEANPNWAKGYLRKGQSLFFLKRFSEAESAYKNGLEIDPNNASIQKQLNELKPYLSGPGGSQPMGGAGAGMGGPGMGGPGGNMPFGSPADIQRKLENDPKTKNYLNDPSYRSMLQDLMTNPNNMTKYMADPRMMDTLSVIMGIDLQAKEGDDEMGQGEPAPAATSTNMDDNMGQKEEEPKKEEPKVETKENEMADDEEPDENVKMAENEKKLGTAAYKAKNFEEAHKHYSKAAELGEWGGPKLCVFRV